MEKISARASFETQQSPVLPPPPQQQQSGDSRATAQEPPLQQSPAPVQPVTGTSLLQGSAEPSLKLQPVSSGSTRHEKQSLEATVQPPPRSSMLEGGAQHNPEQPVAREEEEEEEGGEHGQPTRGAQWTR